MNERIKQLAEQANELDYETFDEYNHKTVQHYKFNKEKFAELIEEAAEKKYFSAGYIAGQSVGISETVRACVDIVNGLSQHQGPGDCSTAEYIREHFGVEE